MLCRHCENPLSIVQWSAAENWKSCPHCSTRDGSEHVFYRYPDKFGTTAARASHKHPEGPQSYCIACRGNKEPDCSEVMLCHEIDNLSL